MSTLATVLACCALPALLWGCNKDAERAPATAHDERAISGERADTTAASRTRSAAEQIAQARCEREQQCGNVGQDETFSSPTDCLSRIQSDWKDDLNSRQCPGGINQEQLNECMAQIRSEDCNNPFDTLARITECTQAQICVEQP